MHFLFTSPRNDQLGENKWIQKKSSMSFCNEVRKERGQKLHERKEIMSSRRSEASASCRRKNKKYEI